MILVQYHIIIIYTECKDGKIGRRCEIDCPFPWYGRQCLTRCNCIQYYCDSTYAWMYW